MLHLVTNHATRKQVAEMLDALGTEIKVAVDVELEILADIYGRCMRILRRPVVR